MPNVDDLNRNFYPVVEETAGNLNEHNWAAGAISDLSKVEHDAAFVWHQAGHYREVLPDSGDELWFIKWSSGHGGDGVAPTLAGSDDEFSVENAWREGTDSRVTFTSPSCLLWIHATLQMTFGIGSEIINNGVCFAIQVDGAVIPETIVGGTESNDKGRLFQLPATTFGTSIVYPVGPGEHTVSMVFMVTTDGGTVNVVYTHSRELICLEMRR